MNHSLSQRLSHGLLVGGWLLLGLLLRVWQFGWHPLREDEALYGYWARLISSGRDVMLERVAVDKPPFFIYALARWFGWFGPSDASGRSLNVLISFLTLILTWLLARRLFGPRGGRWSLAFYALSPFAISFAPTMYTDPLLTLWIVLALLAASWRMGLLAGLALGMGFATKQNALLFIPLILLALPLGRFPKAISNQYATFSRNRHGAKRWMAAIGYGALPLTTAALGFWYIWFKVWQWDGWRILPAEIPDFWTQSWHSYGGLRLVSPDAWPERLGEWWRVWRWWGGGAVGAMLVAGLSAVAVAVAWRRVRELSKQHSVNSMQHLVFDKQYAVSREQAESDAFPDYWILLFAIFSLAYLALHFFLSFQTWDRYLLPLAPLSAMISAQGALWLWRQSRNGKRVGRWGAAALITSILLLGAGRAATAQIPIGGDHGAYDGLTIVADYLRGHTPNRHGLVYQRWLGWQWDWYLWDGPPREYWADPEMLVDNLAPHPTGFTRFVVFPGWRLSEKPALEAALAPLGLGLAERLRVIDPSSGEIKFAVYQIVSQQP